MSEQSAEKPARLSNSQLFFYSLTEAPLMMAIGPVLVFIPAFYAQNMGVGLILVGQIILVVRIFDFFTDPLIGIWSDRTRTRWGRRKPWIAASMPILVAGFFLLFVPIDQRELLSVFFPAEYATEENINGLYMFLCMALLSIGATMIMIPYWSWGAELSPDYNERTRITGVRAVFGIIGSALAVYVPAVAASVFGFAGTEATLIIIGTGMLITLPLAIVLTLWKVPEPKAYTADTSAEKREHTSLAEGVKLMAQNKPFLHLIGAFTFSSTGLTITTPLYLMFIGHVLGAEEQAIYMLAIFYTVNFAGVYFWSRMAMTMSKRKAYIGSFLLIAIVHPAYMLLGPGDFWWMTPITVLVGFAAGAFQAIPNSMKADVIDLDSIESGENRAASYFSTWSFVTKAANAGGAALATIGLGWLGYNAGLGANNTPEDLLILRWMFAVLPSAFYVVAIIFIWKYPINEEYQRRIREELGARAVGQPAQ